MLFFGLVPTSLVDYKDYISCVLFTKGCNMRCPYCHNVELVLPGYEDKLEKYDEQRVFKFLEKRKGQLDAVVITGGEPTIHADLFDFIEKVKNIGYKIKLDTNGTNPDVVKRLIEKNLVDYIAMDVKGPFSRYSEFVGVDLDLDKIAKSINLIKKMDDYEFRTTVYPIIELKDFEEIGKMIEGAKNYSIQQFRPEKTLSEEASKMKAKRTAFLKQACEIMQKYVKNCEIKNTF